MRAWTNELFYIHKTMEVCGDTRQVVEDMVKAIEEGRGVYVGLHDGTLYVPRAALHDWPELAATCLR
jgi:hypothetical protein